MSISHPKVSVIVPNYNYGRYLTERIESILAQTYQNFELILLDDASSDSSIDILRQYQNHPKVSHCLVNEQNSGSPFSQWQKGIDLAQGEYIWIAEADDSASPELLDSLVTALESNPKAVIAHCGSILIDENGQNINLEYDRWICDKSIHYYSSQKYLRSFLSWRCTLYNASMILFRRDVALKNRHGLHLNMYACGDWMYWLQLIEQGGVMVIQAKYNRFRRQQLSVTISHSNSLKYQTERIKCYQFILNSPLISSMQKRLLRGHYYRDAEKLNLAPNDKLILLNQIKHSTGMSRLDYCLLRLYKCLRISI